MPASITETQARKHADDRATAEQHIVFVISIATGLDVCTQEEIYRRHSDESVQVLYRVEPPLPDTIVRAYIDNAVLPRQLVQDVVKILLSKNLQAQEDVAVAQQLIYWLRNAYNPIGQMKWANRQHPHSLYQEALDMINTLLPQPLEERALNVARLRWLLPYQQVDHSVTVTYKGETKIGRTFSDKPHGPGLLLIIPFTPEEKAAGTYATDDYQAYIAPDDILSVHIKNL